MDFVAPPVESQDAGRAHDRRIAAGALKVGLLVLVAKCCVALREVVIARHYGTSAVVDAYNISFTAVTWLPVMIAAAAGVAFVPTLVRLRSDRHRYGRFVAEFNGVVLIGGVAISALTLIGGPAFAFALVGNAAPDTASLAGLMTKQMAIFAGFFLVASLYALRLQAEERFLYSFFEAMPALAVSVAALAVSSIWPVQALVWGTVVGGAAQTVAILTMLRASTHGFGGLARPSSGAEWRHVGSALIAIGLGQALLYSSVPIDQHIASGSGLGGVAVLGYASRLLGIATSMGTVVLARSLLPITASTLADGDEILAWRQTRRWSLLMMAAGGLAAALGVAATPFLVSLLLERGAFGADDSLAVSRAVQIGLVQLPFYLGGLVIVQWLAAHGRYRRIAAIAAVAVMLKLITLLLLPRGWGVDAVMISTVVMYAGSFILQYASLYDNALARPWHRDENSQ